MRTKHNLDGIYFRVERDGKFDNVCFSDLTREEIDKVSENRGPMWWKSVATILAETLYDIGEQLDIYKE